MKNLYNLLAKANVLRTQAEETKEKIKQVSDHWKEKLNKSADEADTLALKGAFYKERGYLP